MIFSIRGRQVPCIERLHMSEYNLGPTRYPDNCPSCNKPLTKKSHLGWMPSTFDIIAAVIRCEHCKKKHKAKQLIIDSYSYYMSMPEINSGKVETKLEDKAKVTMMLKKNKQLLDSLNDGMIPGVSNNIKPLNYYGKSR